MNCAIDDLCRCLWGAEKSKCIKTSSLIMTVNNHVPQKTENEVEIVSGQNYIQNQPFFSHDYKYLFLTSKHTIKVYNTQTAACLGNIYEFRNANKQEVDDEFVAAALHPFYKFQIVTLSNKGTITLWNYTNGLKMKTYNTGYPNCRHLLVTDDYIFIIKQIDGQSHSHEIIAIKWPSRKIDDSINNDIVLSPKQIMLSIPNPYNVCCRNKSLIAAIGEEAMYIYRLNTSSKKKVMGHMPGLNYRFTCITCHPSEDILATGDSSGRIIVWRNIYKSQPIKSIYHWHTLPLATLCFSASGSYLISGGRECVIVKWNLVNEERDFLPRLEAPICHITCATDNARMIVCLQNNSVKLMSLNFNEKLLNLSGLLHRGPTTKPYPVGLLHDPRTKSLVTNGPTGHLQFLNPWQDRLLCNVDVCCQNYHTETRYGAIENSEVVKAAFQASSGIYLATFEYRKDGWSTVESYLKIWEFKYHNNSYLLNTCIRNPHLEHEIDRLCFQRNSSNSDLGRLLISCSAGARNIKAWSPVFTKQPGTQDVSCHWRCSCTATYKMDAEPTGALDFSEDDTVLAAGFGSTIALYDVNINSEQDFDDDCPTLSFNTSLISPTLKQDIEYLAFSYQNKSQFLVGGTCHCVVVWNLLDCQITWMLDTTRLSLTPEQTLLPHDDLPNAFVTALACDWSTGNFALFTSTNRESLEKFEESPNSGRSYLHIFDPAQPKPIESYQTEHVIGADAFANCCAYLPRRAHHQISDTSSSDGPQSSQLFFLTNDQQLFTLQPSQSPSLESAPKKLSYDLLDFETEQKRNPFTSFRAHFEQSRLLAPPITYATANERRSRPTHLNDRVKDIHLSLENCPSQTFPGLNVFSLPYLKCFLPLKSESETNENIKSNDDSPDAPLITQENDKHFADSMTPKSLESLNYQEVMQTLEKNLFPKITISSPSSLAFELLLPQEQVNATSGKKKRRKTETNTADSDKIIKVPEKNKNTLEKTSLNCALETLFASIS